MKKIAIFAAVAATCFGAAAQSTVNVYGRINTSLERQDNGVTKTTGLQNNSSRIGFKGSEDMGGGLKANFVLEAGISGVNGAVNGTTDTGSASLFGRQASVEIAGGFGAVRLGTWFPGSYFATADWISMHNHDTGSTGDSLYAGNAFNRNNSKIGYFTPNVNGFSGEAAMAFGAQFKTATAPEAPKAYDLAGNYDAGALHLGLGYSSQGAQATLTSAVVKTSQLGVRALYEMGPFTVGGYLQRANTNDAAVTTQSRTIGRLAGMYTMGASEFHLALGNTTKGESRTDKASQFTLGYNYNLSKRTKVYAIYNKVDNDVQADASQMVVGVRHNF